MKLRTKLFLWVGVLFFLAFGVSLALEIYTTDKNLKKAEEALRKQIFCLSEETRQNVEHYLYAALSEDQAEINSLLLRIARDPKLGAKLFLDPKDLSLVAPSHSAFIFKNANWIDFLQTTKKGTLTSLLIPIDFPMNISHQIPVNEKVSWIILDKDKEMKHPYIGVKLVRGLKNEKNLAFLVDHLIEEDLGLMVYFDPEAFLHFEKKPSKQLGIQADVDLIAFEQECILAAKYLKETKEKYGDDWIHKAIQVKNKANIFAEKPEDPGLFCMEKDHIKLNLETTQLLQRADQAIMLASLASLFPSDLFGNTPFAPLAPKGIARFSQDAKAGYTVRTAEAFFPSQKFEDAKHYQANPAAKGCRGIASGVAVIAPEGMERVFIGNTLLLKGREEKGYLTVGIDSEKFVEFLVLSVNQSAFLVHDGKVVSAFCQDGRQIHDAKTAIPFQKKMLKEKSGIMHWNGEDYYFLHMIPFESLDLHFYILQPEKEAFALVRSVGERSRRVIANISFNMRVIALVALAGVLFLLHRIAKGITKPIARLASLTEDVAKGKLEGIDLPTPTNGKSDEIAILCRSFSQMIKGLQEKEKVKGILNKVVSPQIAKEITKEQIHLGGEEKKITVLFADIRNFTGMSRNKPPHEVIELLNTCMTKISHVIDEHEGVIDKYVGDEVMALFGAPLQKEESALQAIRCGLEIVKVLHSWNEERAKTGLSPVEMGIGIHTGVVLVGNMGAENRLNYTVIGSNVNLAARICSIAKGMEILISKATLDEPNVKENIKVEELPPTTLKGFEKSFVLYKVQEK